MQDLPPFVPFPKVPRLNKEWRMASVIGGYRVPDAQEAKALRLPDANFYRDPEFRIPVSKPMAVLTLDEPAPDRLGLLYRTFVKVKVRLASGRITEVWGEKL